MLGLNGMPRRIYTYLAATGWGPLNLVATARRVHHRARRCWCFSSTSSRAALAGRSRATIRGDSSGLEWATTSPPPQLQLCAPPVVRACIRCGRRPSSMPVITGLRTDRREDPRHLDLRCAARLATSSSPSGSIWPLYLGALHGCRLHRIDLLAVLRPRRHRARRWSDCLGWGSAEHEADRARDRRAADGAIVERA